MKQIKMLAGIVLIISASMLVSGCFLTDWAGKKTGEKIMEGAIESQTGGKVDVDADKNEMTINTEQGSTSVSQEGEGKLPENFPSDVYIYSDAKITVSSTIKENEGFSVNYITEASPDEAVSKYKEEMEKNGWTKQNELSMGKEPGAMMTFKKEDRSAMITVSVGKNDKHEGKTIIFVVVTKEKSYSEPSE